MVLEIGGEIEASAWGLASGSFLGWLKSIKGERAWTVEGESLRQQQKRAAHEQSEKKEEMRRYACVKLVKL